MRKAFDQNVSKARPKIRLGAQLAAPEPEVTQTAEPPPRPPELADEVRARVEKRDAPSLTAKEALTAKLDVAPEPPRVVETRPLPASTEVFAEPPEPAVPEERASLAEPAVSPEVPEVHSSAAAQVTEARVEPELEVEPETFGPEALEPSARRERLKERLRAVRENPKPEPLPATAAEAGLRAVERISALQEELGRVRALNQGLAQDLEAARRQSERDSEEARLRVDEARRLAEILEQRGLLLSDLEREMSALEGERDEALLALQESRQASSAAAEAHVKLEEEIARRDRALAESLAEEERLADELEASKDETRALRRSVEALTSERETLVRQVADLERERGDLLEARRALEAVHKALSQATVR